MADKLLFKTSTSNDSSYLTKSNSTVAKSPGTVYFTKDGKIVYDLNSNTRLVMSDNVSYATLNQVASLAAYHSKLKNSPKVEVDYTLVKNVKKIPGAKPGMVIYENYKTLYVEPLESLN